jgi:hypothetical protein
MAAVIIIIINVINVDIITAVGWIVSGTNLPDPGIFSWQLSLLLLLMLTLFQLWDGLLVVQMCLGQESFHGSSHWPLAFWVSSISIGIFSKLAH